MSVRYHGDYRVRLLMVVVFFFALFAIIAIRLFLLQVYQKDFFTGLAQQQYGVSIKLDQPRATIYDRSGKVELAFNRDAPSVFILPGQLEDASRLESFLRNNYKDVYTRLKNNPARHFLWVDRKITQDRLAFLQRQGLVDLKFINEQQRFYPYQSLAHVIGFTDIDNNGIAGIELGKNKLLAGEPASVRLERDARSKSFYFSQLVEQPGVKGRPVTLTIDSTLQALAFEELVKNIEYHHAKSGSVVIMDPDSGEILAMANYPVFDPNQKGIPRLEVTKNFIVTECFELGSVLKAFCAFAAFEEGAVQYDELIDCEGKVAFIDGFRVENWKSCGVVPFYDVIKNSSNIGVAKVAKRLGPKLYTHLRRVGFGSKTGLEFPGERSGFVNPPEHWSRSSVLVMSFGYEIMASLLQLCRAFCIIANGGYSVQPVLFKDPAPKPFARKKLYKDETIFHMKNVLEKIGEKYPVKGCRIFGKTGTARCIDNGHYSKKDHVYTFVGVVEKENYRRVILAFVAKPEQSNLWAAGVAAPIFHRLAEKMVMYEKKL